MQFQCSQIIDKQYNNRQFDMPVCIFQLSPLHQFIINHHQLLKMSEEYTLPPISQQTKEKLDSYGFKNHLYDYLDLPSIYIPRGKGFDNYTYLIMGLSAIGGVLAKRFKVDSSSFICAFIAAPFMSFIQKKQADTVFNSEYSKRHPSVVLQQFPILNQSYKQVRAEIDAEIQASKERIRLLEERKNRTNI